MDGGARGTVAGERDPRSRCRLRHPRRHAHASPELDAAQRTGVGVPAGPGATPAVAPVPAEQPRLRAGRAAASTPPRGRRDGLPGRRRSGTMKARLTNAMSTKATSGGRRERPDEPRPLAIGDVVEVKPAEQILAGLDERGELDALPFMPEMLQFCGQRFVVDKIAFKTCDTVSWTGLRRLTDTVHLAGVRCDGRAHGGCQAGCLIFWK